MLIEAEGRRLRRRSKTDETPQAQSGEGRACRPRCGKCIGRKSITKFNLVIKKKEKKKGESSKDF